MTPDEMRAKTKSFALAAIQLCRTLPRDEASRVIGRQLVRCATSVGANYRAACLAKSPADMVNKLKMVEEEADEACYWLELLVESNSSTQKEVVPLQDEAKQIFRIVVASVKTLRNRKSSTSQL